MQPAHGLLRAHPLVRVARVAACRKESHKDKALRRQHELDAREQFAKYGVRRAAPTCCAP